MKGTPVTLKRGTLVKNVRLTDNDEFKAPISFISGLRLQIILLEPQFKYRQMPEFSPLQPREVLIRL